MASRYFALIGADRTRLTQIADLVERRTGLMRVADHPEMVLLAREGLVVNSTSDGQLLVAGRLFSHPGHDAHEAGSLDLSGQRDIWSATDLLEQCWGGYVAFIRRGGTAVTLEVLRDPSGAMPCYRFEAEGLMFLCSDVELAIRSGLYAPVIDWNRVLYDLWAVALRSRPTALHGFTEIPCGQSLIWRASGSGLIERWSPWRHVARLASLTDEELAHRLRSTIRTCVTQWAGSFRHVLHCLSGGLDSSIVAACLAQSDIDVTTMILLARGSDGDERAYAEAVARHVGLPLVQRRYDLEPKDIAISSAAHLPRPVGALGRLAFDRACNEEAARIGADGQFSGNGGDNVFCYLTSSTPVLDRLWREGIGRGSWTTLGDMARLTGTSLWSIGRHGLKSWWRGSGDYRWPPLTQFLDLGAVDAAGLCARHPWLQAPPRALRGEKAHIAALLRPQNYSEGHARDSESELVTPLLAQPIVELCLGIPSWRWCAGGRNRSLARRAFSDALPQRIIDRRSKGGPGGFYQEVVERHGPALREHLLDGVLADRGLLDRAAIEAYFTRSDLGTADDYVRILALSDAESWVRHWQGRCHSGPTHVEPRGSG